MHETHSLHPRLLRPPYSRGLMADAAGLFTLAPEHPTRNHTLPFETWEKMTPAGQHACRSTANTAAMFLSVIVVVAIKSMRCAASVHQRCLDSWSLLICRYIVCDPGEVIPQNDWVSAPRGQMKRMADRGSLPMIVAAAHLDYCATAAALN